uniref:Uncharacterized protein n=1 Tax=Anguilla anguilla TaxID=7936 RepID=A0A0E9RMS7_ANGAN
MRRKIERSGKDHSHHLIITGCSKV